MLRTGAAAGLVLLASCVLTGCASTPYPMHPRAESDLTLRLAEGESQVERGRPHAWVDGFGHWLFSLPTKILMLDWRVLNHDVSPEVEEALQEYLWVNGLCNTKVRINQYAPGAEWKRLFRNREMPGGWRYTLGVFSVARYTIFPDRLFAGFPFIGGGDSYNPYTNTIHVYSDLRSVVLHEGGHGKDFDGIESRHWKGFYAGARAVPLAGVLVALVQEARASNDALSWELAVGDSADSKSAYRTLYPAYGTYLGGAAQTGASFFADGWILYAIQYGVVVAGHVAGQTRALFVRDRDGGLQPALVEDPALLGEALPPGSVEVLQPYARACGPEPPPFAEAEIELDEAVDPDAPGVLEEAEDPDAPGVLEEAEDPDAPGVLEEPVDPDASIELEEAADPDAPGAP